jgi:hypothetical protein
MKQLSVTVAALGLLAVSLPSLSSAAEGPKARLFANYDTNKNGIIDGDEIEAVRKAYAADPKGEFARYDTNHDGKLDDQEIAAIKPPGAKPADGQKKSGGKKKSDPAPADPKSDPKADPKPEPK